jgi:hypothetical protein
LTYGWTSQSMNIQPPCIFIAFNQMKLWFMHEPEGQEN